MPNFVETSDFLNRSTILRATNPNRVTFDPTNGIHLESLRSFIATGNWGSTMFHCEFPFTDVPTTVMMKFTGHMLGAHRETAESRIARIANAETVN
jgi:hypothetical protein